jgi:hypothetical protein
MSSLTEQQNLYNDMVSSLKELSATPEEAYTKLAYVTAAAQNHDLNAIRIILENDGITEEMGKFLISVFADVQEFDGLDTLLIECSNMWVDKFPNLADPFARTYADRVASGKSISPLLQKSLAQPPSQSQTPTKISISTPSY